ncbi:MAG: glycerate kinase [Blastocatellia bacterium]
MTSTSELREAALSIFHKTLAAIDAETVVAANLRLAGDRLLAGDDVIDLNDYSKLLVIAIGKASVPMARAAERVLGGRITAGLVVTNAVIGDSPRLPFLIGGHPLPNAASLEAAAKALALLREHDGEQTLVLFLISGGGSAMFEQPIDPAMTLDDLQAVNKTLVNCGAVINEMNIVRRHLSAVKGGKLAAAAPRSRQVSLYISDVNSDDLTTVASGPTLPDASTIEDFQRIIERYNLMNQFPANVVRSSAFRRNLPPPEGGTTNSHHLLMDNRRAMLEAKQIAERDYGFMVELAEDQVEDHVEAMMLAHIERIVLLQAKHKSKPVCLISGGEAICPVRGNGQGGRNQEFILRAAIQMDFFQTENIVALSAGTDGIDGHSPAAGAIADAETLARAAAIDVSAEAHLINSDSFNFFNSIGDAIITGPTGNNVRDLRILLAG